MYCKYEAATMYIYKYMYMYLYCVYSNRMQAKVIVLTFRGFLVKVVNHNNIMNSPKTRIFLH